MIRILSHFPKEYLEQGLSQCGAYCIKAILGAHGKDDKKHPRDYQPNLFAKYTVMNQGPTLWPKVFKSYGLNTEKGDVKNLSDEQKIELLVKSIDNDKAIMLRIGNGYSKSGKYNSFVAFFLGHWITLWGYNDEEKVFYVYDSYVSLERHDKTIPVGNTKRTYAEIIRDLGRGFPTAWRYSFISVSDK